MFEKRAWWVVGVLVLAMVPGTLPVRAQEGDDAGNRVSYDFPDKGGFRYVSSGDESEPVVFHSEVGPTGGSTLPSGFGIFSFRNPDGSLLTETTVPLQDTLTGGRMIALFSDRSNTGLAIANPNDQAVTIEYFFTEPGAEGPEDFGAGTLAIPARGQFAQFLSEAPFGLDESTTVSMTFSASLPVAAIALLQTRSVTDEVVYNTMPVIDLDEAPATTTTFMPHISIGGAAWSTDFVLINPTNDTIQGGIGVVGTGALHPDNPEWDVPGQTVSTTFSDIFSPLPIHGYELPPRGVLVWSSVAGLSLTTGAARVTPVEGHAVPVVQVILNSLGVVENADGQPVLERQSRAAYSSSGSGTSFRMYVESQGELGAANSINSGIAIHSSNWINRPGEEYKRVRVGLELRSLDDTFAATTEIEIPSSGQRALFLDELFADVELPDPFFGTLTATVLSPERTIAVVALRIRVTEDERFLITTTPPTDANATPIVTNGYLPQLVVGGGWQTETILFSGVNSQAATGEVVFTAPDGTPFELPADE